jgi:hypothetical protein
VPILFDQVVAQPLGCGANGHFAPDPSDAIFNPRIAQQNSNRFDFRWSLKDTDTE